MGILCNQSDDKKGPGTYVQKGSIVIIKFITPEMTHPKPISIHDENTLAIALEMFQNTIGLPGRKIKKVAYEGDYSPINVKKTIRELNIDYVKNLTVFF